MRVVLVGRPRAIARLRSSIAGLEVEVAGEASSIAEARALGADAFLVAPEDDGTGSVEVRAARGTTPDVPDESLTPREHDVLELVAEGLSNKAIAARLGISDQTVKFHVASICAKLRVSNRTEAVRRALRRGLITL